MASSPKSHKELTKQDVPIKFDATFNPNCLVYCHYEYKRSIAMFDITWLDKALLCAFLAVGCIIAFVFLVCS